MKMKNKGQLSETKQKIEPVPVGKDVQMKSSATDLSGPEISDEKSENIEKVNKSLINNQASESKDLAPIKGLAAKIGEMEIKNIESEIGKACKQCAENVEIAVKASTLVVSYAWLTGKLLLRAKSLLKKKGEFGEWCQTSLVDRGLMSVKTAQRYMAVAKKWDSLDAMLTDIPNLSRAYQAAGIVPVPEESGCGAESEKSVGSDKTAGGPPSDKVKEYVAEFSKLNKLLRHIKELRGKIGADVPEEEQATINVIIEKIISFVNEVSGKPA